MVRARRGVAVLATVLSLVHATPATGTDATTTTVTRTYAATTRPQADPERGFYHYSETALRPDGSGWVPLDAGALVRARTAEQVTLVYRIVVLDGYADRDVVDAAALARLAADLDTARAAGVKLVLRFAYTTTWRAAPPYGDAPVARTLGHVRQLLPVVNGAADVVAAFQAGFVGLWGEWYYTDHFAADPARPWVLSEVDRAARRALLLTVLDALDPSVPVQVRYPAAVRDLLTTATSTGPVADPRAARVGVHDDCFLASPDDYGTYRDDADRTWLADLRGAVVGGETCAPNAPRSQWPTAAAELARYRWSFLNADYHGDVLASWGADGRAEAARRLGARLRLVSSGVRAAVRPGASAGLAVRLTNDGWAAPVRRRPVRVVLAGDGGTFAVTLPADVRRWEPGAAVSLGGAVCAPPVPGRYRVLVELPDASPRLATTAPLPVPGAGTAAGAYALRLDGAPAWDAVTGRNDLGQTLVVDPAAAPATRTCSLVPVAVPAG